MDFRLWFDLVNNPGLGLENPQNLFVSSSREMSEEFSRRRGLMKGNVTRFSRLF